MSIVDQLIALLEKKNRDFLPLKSVRDALPAAVLRDLNLKRRVSSVSDIRTQLEPHLNQQLMLIEGPRTTYLGYRMSTETLILKQLRKKPGLSSRQLKQQLPFKETAFIQALNRLLSSSKLRCQLKPSTHIALLEAVQGADETTDSERIDDKTTFENAFKTVGRGKQFVRIHQIRGYLNWDDERFDAVLEKLKSEFSIQLHAGDPSLLTEEELRDSYRDKKGRLRITINWVD